MTDPVSAVGAPPRAPAQRISPDVDSFLTLLTAQVSNQDPLAPMDSSTFVTQLAQLSQVEQSMDMSAQLQAISAQLSETSTVALLGLVGRAVEAEGVTLTAAGGTFSYELGGAADGVTIDVRAPDGTLVRRMSGAGGAAGARHVAEWDGRDDAGLPVVGGGPFAVTVAGRTAADALVEARTIHTGQVEGIARTDAGPRLRLGDGRMVDPAVVLGFE